MRAAFFDLHWLRRRVLLAATLAIVLSGVTVGFLGGARPTLGAGCTLRCATLTVTLGGNGTGVLAVVTSTGALTGTIECHRAGGTTYGTCAFAYPVNSVIYYRVAPATGSKTVCKVLGCDTTTSIKHFTLSANMTLSAYGFALLDPVTVTVSVTGTGSGTVTSKPIGINCGGGKTACSVPFAAGSSVSLTAAAASGSAFKGWTGRCTGTQATCTFTATSGTSVSVGAQFGVVVTATPTPKPTATHAPTPPPTSRPTTTPTSAPHATPAGPTSALAASPEVVPSAEPSAEPGPTGAPVAVGGGSLPPIATPNDAAGQPASNSDSGGSFILPIVVALLVLLVGGAFVFRKPGVTS